MLLLLSYFAVASSATTFGFLLHALIASNSTTDKVETVITLPKSEYKRL